MSYSSDDEDLECPLCLEEIDLTDKYFKPCPCGYQICRFCWNHINENLNKLCPACRRPFSDKDIEFTPISLDEVMRIRNAKKQKERERREQENNAKRQLANVRVVQKNLVYVLGLPLRLATDEILKSNDFFGQFGKIMRVVVNRRGGHSHANAPLMADMAQTGVYVTYYKKEDAMKAIEAVDGSVLEGRVIRATFGTTKYCSYFLKNQPCPNGMCPYLHEIGEDADAIEKEEMA
ncbi:RING/Ubox like zinc-binding domain-containing protein [Polychytrium aggregatum]|uniref:RING/Ubox like zinc-binding domain-containing protein n=1 Tax=Polychytrium aggregatum TaxID=110093 RepID=UPI0022FE1F71|nr:RING/Ubox like zinc-binding domain-containing protein [Polychytrium aggregatum]KAI9207632.1 RING/Ubox like zinc-binding domain-containing protein [Polychytrium aggregatum]